jgi:hypothetical protein
LRLLLNHLRQGDRICSLFGLRNHLRVDHDPGKTFSPAVGDQVLFNLGTCYQIVKVVHSVLLRAFLERL